ncbi:WbuC family cupin fold metalloprotein [Leptospira meyeri]|uniref:WbuC family cupin fold metalloprotein n=1 Tax=Leptospira meyeri TaxID=29508 RepID=UPI000C29E6C5|nr:WbuC family cupin fold metalloprotein [Leptospira meyeri]PKA22544.1 cupin [Leptospira sp. mixed culture ATI2-C-A1]MCW7488367.1 WbuC family cupin fold metalloprotein [Leptospira meyeri]TGL15175.1 cupin fold metalloprotein, WbuC family [Leptospira meyeri]TGM19577.1 cupin fold metalloprotein, WbuC family [Leptospira meyeri]TGM64025.1 cupin fold metalloprotein, WbuC family [Leptospira meyeri]
MQEIQVIDSDLIGTLVIKAQNAERKRTNFNFHEQKEVYQRFLNVLSKDTYIPPHRHLSDPKPETFIILEGEIGFLIFDEDGEVKESHKLSANGPKRGIDLQPGVWHSLVCLSETAVCFEGKSGPYDPTVDKEFHPKYPLEGNPKFIETIKSFESLFL